MTPAHDGHAQNAVVYHGDPLYMQCNKNNS